MLLSMTGHGEALGKSTDLHVAVEIRSVNNRYLKLVLRAHEPYNLLEAEVEKVVRKYVRRGTIQVHLHVDRPRAAADFQVNTTALTSYFEQVRQASEAIPGVRVEPGAWMGAILALPGVVPETHLGTNELAADWPGIETVLVDALRRLQSMREDEGRHMAEELLAYREAIVQQLQAIRERIPNVVVNHRDRLLERVRALMADSGVSLEPDHLVREVSIFADRSDVSEEVVRLDSHLEQFQQTVLHEGDTPGRKLEFLVQEMGRETNTIGSKSGDIGISRHVVEIKATLEKVRELIQNVE